MIDSWRDVQPSPAPDMTARVRRYSPYEVIRVDLIVDGDSYTGIARASYNAAGAARLQPAAVATTRPVTLRLVLVRPRPHAPPHLPRRRNPTVTDLEDPVEARPWWEGDGQAPTVWTWPFTDPPGLWVRHTSSWRWALVTARQNWPDGRVAYQVLIDTDGTTHRTYWWPHEGLRVAHRSASEPTTEAGRGGDLPRPPRRVKFA